MARTYSGTPTMSKIKLPSGNTYFLKDADVRTILDSINDNVFESLKLALGTVDAGGSNLVTAANIKDYVDRIAEIGFDVVVLETLPEASESAYKTYHNNIVLIADAKSTTGAYVEYVILRQGTEGAYTYKWERIGTTQIDLSGYLKNVAYVDATHTLTQTKNENGVDVTTNVHQFGNLADANTASSAYTPAGTITSVEVMDSVGTQASKAADVFVAPTFTEGTFTPNTPTTLDLTKFDGGSKAKDTFTQGTLPSKAADTFNAGALPSFKEGAFNKGALPSLSAATSGTFTVEGIVAAIGTGDDAETLIFSNAAVTQAITDRGTFDAGALPSKEADTFTAGTLPSYTEGTFDAGSLPTFTEGAFTAATLNTGFYTVGVAASKDNDTFTAGSFTEGTFTANVLPTKKTVTPTFAGTGATITVSPDPKN